MKIKILTIFFSLLYGVGFTQQKEAFISKEKAIDIANDDLGFGNTWIKTELKKGQWELYSLAINDNPSMYFVIDAVTGNFLLRIYDASDMKQDKKVKRFLKRIHKESYLEPEWVRGVSKILESVLGAIVNFST